MSLLRFFVNVKFRNVFRKLFYLVYMLEEVLTSLGILNNSSTPVLGLITFVGERLPQGRERRTVTPRECRWAPRPAASPLLKGRCIGFLQNPEHSCGFPSSSPPLHRNAANSPSAAKVLLKFCHCRDENIRVIILVLIVCLWHTVSSQ